MSFVKNMQYSSEVVIPCHDSQLACVSTGDCDNWEDYGDCSKTCGGGVQVRTRECPENSLHLKQQKKHCNTNLCPGQSKY